MRGVGWVSEIGGGIRVLGTRVLREVWDADFGGVVVGFGLVVGFWRCRGANGYWVTATRNPFYPSLQDANRF